MEPQFAIKDKVLVLRLTRLGRIPPALYSTEILVEQGLPVLALEYGNVREHKSRVDGKIPRLRVAVPWAALFPRRIRPSLIFLGTFLRLSWLVLTQGRPRLMIAHGINEQVLALFLYRVFGVPYVAHVHEVFSEGEILGLNVVFFWLEGVALRRALFLIYPEKERAEIYRTRYGLKVPFEIAGNCPRLRRGGPGSPRVDLRAELRLPPDSRLLGYFGGIGKYNALADGIRAVARIPRLYFLLWGWGDKAFTEGLRELARGVGAGDRILFLGELPEDKWGTLENLDISYCVYEPELLRLKYAATASNKLMESFAAGVPVLTNGASDFREIVQGRDVGLCVPEISVDAIAAALKDLLQDKLGLKRRSENGLKCHREIFHYEAQYRSTLERLRALVPQAGPERDLNPRRQPRTAPR